MTASQKKIPKRMALKKPNLNKRVFKLYPEKLKLVQRGNCVICKKKIKEKDFRDEKSRKEYSISGICQACQDTLFEDTYID
jgi:hypothetical protein